VLVVKQCPSICMKVQWRKTHKKLVEMLCERWHQLTPVLDVGMQPTLLETTTNTLHDKYSKCKPKEFEECLLCAKQCKVGGSTLRKHACLADMSLESFEMQHIFCDAVCEELSPMPDNDFQQLGLASHQPEDVALAAFELLYLNPKHPQYQNVAPCQYNSGKLSIVLPTKQEQKGDNKEGIWTNLWWAFPKAEVLDGVDFDDWSTAGVLKNVSDFLEKLIKDVSHRLSEHCMQGLPSYIEHIVKPVAAACRPHYEHLWRVQRPNMVVARVTLCDKICSLLDGHPRQAHH